MHGKLCTDEAKVATDSSGEVWHKRLAYPSRQKMSSGSKRDTLGKVCQLRGRKANRVAFHSRPPKRREVALELVHTDVCYVDAQSHRGGPYFVTFIDSYNSKVWDFRIKVKGSSTIVLQRVLGQN